MKKFGFFTAMILMGALAAGCGKAEASTTVAVDSMICNTCVGAVQTALGGLEGVTLASIDLDAKTAFVTFDDSKTSVASIEDAIVAAGYSANNKMADPTAFKSLPGCCR